MLSYINNNTGAQYVCVSTDKKQTDVPNGSILFEMDTGTFYLFDRDRLIWEPQANCTKKDLVLVASDGSKYKVMVSPDGVLSTDKVV